MPATSVIFRGVRSILHVLREDIFVIIDAPYVNDIELVNGGKGRPRHDETANRGRLLHIWNEAKQNKTNFTLWNL